jgi:hypothetical protein
VLPWYMMDRRLRAQHSAVIAVLFAYPWTQEYTRDLLLVWHSGEGGGQDLGARA